MEQRQNNISATQNGQNELKANDTTTNETAVNEAGTTETIPYETQIPEPAVQDADPAEKTDGKDAETEQPVTEGDTEEPSQEEWAKALTETVRERDEYKDKYLRSQAEFQNYKRRTALTRSEAYEDGVRETIAAMLPALDNLELALKHAETAQDSASLTQGVSMTLKLMTEALGKLGLEEVPALGEEFDPEKHNAVLREPGGEENKICEVFQKGYKVHDRMIRYAMVKVFSGAEA